MRRIKTRQLTALGLMLAMIVALSIIEHTMPPIPGLPPGVRLGLSNVVTMYALFFMGRIQAILLAVLKSVFVLLTRGGIAGLLSFGGGIISILGILALILIFGDRISYLALSVFGAILHNIGQISISAVILGSGLVFLYIPPLIISGVIMGTVTGTLLRVIMPLWRIR